jgi:hypothetical protein
MYCLPHEGSFLLSVVSTKEYISLETNIICDLPFQTKFMKKICIDDSDVTSSKTIFLNYQPVFYTRLSARVRTSKINKNSIKFMICGITQITMAPASWCHDEHDL